MSDLDTILEWSFLCLAYVWVKGRVKLVTKGGDDATDQCYYDVHDFSFQKMDQEKRTKNCKYFTVHHMFIQIVNFFSKSFVMSDSEAHMYFGNTFASAIGLILNEGNTFENQVQEIKHSWEVIMYDIEPKSNKNIALDTVFSIMFDINVCLTPQAWATTKSYS